MKITDEDAEKNFSALKIIFISELLQNTGSTDNKELLITMLNILIMC